MRSHPNVAARVASGTRCSSECAQSSQASSSRRQCDARPLIGCYRTQDLGNLRNLRRFKIAQRPTDRTAVEAAKVHRSFGGLRLTKFPRQGAKRIPKPVKVTRFRCISVLDRAIGIKDEFGQCAAIGRTNAVEPTHHRTEEREIGATDQLHSPADPVRYLVDRGWRQVALLDTNHTTNIG